jgi:hypothetical protein
MSRHCSLRHPLWGLLLLCVLVTPSLAQKSKGSRNQKGRTVAPAAPPVDHLSRLLAQAQAALLAKDFPGAYRALLQAYPLAPGLMLFHLGALAAAEQKPTEARDLLRRFLADPTVDANAPERAEAQKQLEQLAIVEAGEVSVGAPRGAQVQLDGRLVGTLPLPTPLLTQTGPHRVAVSQGHWSSETEVQVRTARLSEVRFKAGSDVAVVTLPAAVLYCDSYQASQAQAEKQAAAPGPGLDAAASESFAQALESALKRESYALLTRENALIYAKDLPACQNLAGADNDAVNACCEQLAQRYAMDYILDARIAHTGEDWELKTVLRDMQVDDTAASASSNCSSCSVDKAATRLGETATQLLGQASGRSRGTLEVSSNPPGAEVWLSGRRLGQTPYQHAVWTGSYQLELRQSGYRTSEQSIAVTADKPAHFEVALETAQKPPPTFVIAAPVVKARPPRVPKRPAWRIDLGVVSMGAGALLLGFGAGALAINAGCALSGMPEGPTCPRSYNTIGVGSSLLAAGGAVELFGIILIAIPPKR